MSHAAPQQPQAQAAQSVFPKSHVGFDSITKQIERKSVKRGFQFNVICVGMTHHHLSNTCIIGIDGVQDRLVSASRH